MIPTFFGDKYGTVRTLQETAASAVVLIKHRQIGDVRILKAIHKSHPDATNILSEANLLSGIRSPQIPTIYDVGQLDGWNYLIEEYIEGETLQEILLNNQTISKDKIFEITIGLCRIFEILHLEGNDPVIYRDLKPEHVIVDQNMIRLIDFGISVRKSQVKMIKVMGSSNWAAPEQLEGQDIDERSDIYGIGRIMLELIKKSKDLGLVKYKHLADRAAERNIEKRIQSIAVLIEELLAIQSDSKMSYEREKKHLKSKIAVVGADTAIGCTHIAIMLNKYLNKNHIRSIYCDKGESKNVITISRSVMNARIKEGVLYHDDFAGVMEYGPAVEKKELPSSVQILDYGTNYTNCIDADSVIVVVSGCPWKKIDNLPDIVMEKNVVIISNFSNRLSTILLSKELGKRIYRFPMGTSGTLTRKEKKLFDAINKREQQIW